MEKGLGQKMRAYSAYKQMINKAILQTWKKVQQIKAEMIIFWVNLSNTSYSYQNTLIIIPAIYHVIHK